MKTSLKTSALALTAAVILSGCSSPSEPNGEDPSPAKPAADEQSIGTENFVTNVPDDWKDIAGTKGTEQATVVYAEPDATEFATNINIIESENGGDPSEEEVREQVEKELAPIADSTEYTGPVTVDGEEGYGFTSELSTAGLDLTIYQTQVSSDGTSYVITVTTSDAASGAEVNESALAGFDFK